MQKLNVMASPKKMVLFAALLIGNAFFSFGLTEPEAADVPIKKQLVQME